MMNLGQFIGKLTGAGKSLAGEVAGEVIGIGVAEKMWGSKFLNRFKPHAERAYEAITVSWLGSLTDSAERAFSSIVTAYTSYLMNHNFLAPWHAQPRMDRALTFLKAKSKIEYAAYRRALARDPDQQRRIMLFAQLVQASTPAAQENAFRMAFKDPTGPEVVKFLREKAPQAWDATKRGARATDNWFQHNLGQGHGGQAFNQARTRGRNEASEHFQQTLASGFLPRPIRRLIAAIAERLQRNRQNPQP